MYDTQNKITQKYRRKINKYIYIFVQKRKVHNLFGKYNLFSRERTSHPRAETKPCVSSMHAVYYANVLFKRVAQDFSPNAPSPPRYRSPIPWNRSHGCQLWPSSSHKFCACAANHIVQLPVWDTHAYTRKSMELGIHV